MSAQLHLADFTAHLAEATDTLTGSLDRSPQTVHMVALLAVRRTQLYKDASPAQKPKIILAAHNILLALVPTMAPIPEPEPEVEEPDHDEQDRKEEAELEAQQDRDLAAHEPIVDPAQDDAGPDLRGKICEE